LIYFHQMQQKYKIKSRHAFVYLLLLFIVCYFIRQLPIPFLSDHIMNFSLSGGILVLSTYPDLIGKGITKISLISIVIFWSLVNIVIEFFVTADEIPLPGVTFTNFNTSDPLDALFGLFGIGLFTFVFFKYGAKKSVEK
jgi:hypothetical protein